MFKHIPLAGLTGLDAVSASSVTRKERHDVRAAVRRARLEPGVERVLLELLDRADLRTGLLTVSQAALASCLSYSVRAVGRAVAILRHLGWISVHHRRRGPASYRLTWAVLLRLIGSVADAVAGRVARSMAERLRRARLGLRNILARQLPSAIGSRRGYEVENGRITLSATDEQAALEALDRRLAAMRERDG